MKSISIKAFLLLFVISIFIFIYYKPIGYFAGEYSLDYKQLLMALLTIPWIFLMISGIYIVFVLNCKNKNILGIKFDFPLIGYVFNVEKIKPFSVSEKALILLFAISGLALSEDLLYYWPTREVTGFREIIDTRKFELIYNNWIMALLMISLTVIGLILNSKNKIILGKKVEFALGSYVFIGGVRFFNYSCLTHSMYNWGEIQFIKSSLWSLGIASLPIVLLYFVLRNRNQQIKENKIVFFSLIPSNSANFHSK